MCNLKTFEIYYRRAGYPNANIYCKSLKAKDIEEAKMFAYMEINENYVIVNIIDTSKI